jgi:hypothetical protein
MRYVPYIFLVADLCATKLRTHMPAGKDWDIVHLCCSAGVPVDFGD